MPNRIPAEGKYNFIDLFAGAGGLSEGFIQAGFNPIAHVEMNSFAAQTLVTRSAYYYLKQVKQLDIYYQYLRGEITRDAFLEKIPNRITKTVICETMSNDTLPGIFKTIDGIMKLRNMQSVDVVIGGPPCQAYSLVGRAQSSHMDHPMSEDPRNELYKLYARVLKRYQPRMFVFENVMGISSANEGTTFKNLKKYLRRVGYEIEWHEQNSKSFGVLQNRRRMIIVGWLKNSGMAYPEFLKKESPFTVNDLLSDLPKLKPGLGSSEYRTKTWSKTNYGRSVEYKHAIVDYFKEHSKILIVTDAGSEGLNLQFCNTVINYDLPWNPQKIEQRIGRCHRYGQKYDVVAINLLNTGNEADRRVYEILSKKFELFDGVFGASDIALGALESGTSFEKTILEIYQNCGTRAEFKKAFDRLDRQLDAKRNKKAVQLRSILMTESDAAKGAALEKTKNDIDQYLQQVDFWTQVAEPDVEGNLNYWKIDNWGERTFGSHGTLFVGAFCNSNNEMLFPVLLLCDEQGRYIDFTENDIVQALENVNDDDVRYFKPTDEELASYRNIYDTLVQEMLSKYQASSKPVMDYNKRKVENWADIQREQLNIQIAEMNAEIDELSAEATAAKDFLEKVDIRKKVDEKKKQLQKVQTSFHQKVSSIQEEAEREIAEFNQQFDIQPILLVNVVLKF